MNRAASCRRAFTLFELLIAMVLSSLIIGFATSAVMQMRLVSQRILVRQQMFDSARIFYERMNTELSSLSHATAFFVTSTAPSGGTPGRIELVFMRGKYSETDFTFAYGFGASAPRATDMLWSRLLLDDATQSMSLANSSPTRKFMLTADWINPNGTNFKGAPFMNLPTPQRAASLLGAQATLDANRYDTGSPGDIGDYQDLLANTLPLTLRSTNFCVQVVQMDGTVQTFTTGANASLAADGLFIDGRVGPQLAARPRLIRFRFDLFDQRTTLVQTFTFSFQTPALSPG